MTIFYAVLLIFYAAGCMAAVIECAAQYREASDSHPARMLRRDHPIANVIANLVVVVCWPVFVIWHLIHEALR